MKYYEKNKIKAISVESAVGQVLLHDITQIVPDIFKGPCFRKGHIIQPEDVEKLLDMGKKRIYVASLNDNEVHENDAAIRIAKAACGHNIDLSEPKEGKVGFTAQIQGLLKVNVEGLYKLNSLTRVIFSTLHTNQTVTRGKELAGTRVIPLIVDEDLITRAEKVCEKYFPIIEVKPFAKMNIGMIITGSEVYNGRIQDGFGPVIEKKFNELKSSIIGKKIVSDDIDMTVRAIREFLDIGADMIVVTGGMSVDPDDLTPSAILEAGGEMISYGAPVLPGAMFMLSKINKVAVIGLPACVMYYRASIFDLIVPRLLAGESVNQADIIAMGHGGLCSSCKNCRYPSCSFGK